MWKTHQLVTSQTHRNRPTPCSLSPSVPNGHWDVGGIRSRQLNWVLVLHLFCVFLARFLITWGPTMPPGLSHIGQGASSLCVCDSSYISSTRLACDWRSHVTCFCRAEIALDAKNGHARDSRLVKYKAVSKLWSVYWSETTARLLCTIEHFRVYIWAIVLLSN